MLSVTFSQLKRKYFLRKLKRDNNKKMEQMVDKKIKDYKAKMYPQKSDSGTIVTKNDQRRVKKSK